MKLTKYPFHGMIDRKLEIFKVKPLDWYGEVWIERVLFADARELLDYEYNQIALLYSEDSEEAGWT